MAVTVGSYLQGMRWCNASHTPHQWAHLGTKYQECMGLTDRLSRATNLIHNFTICLVLWEWRSIDVSWELPVKIAAP
jgi:hypothetical protein